GPHGGTAPAAAEPPQHLAHLGVDVRCAVHHDLALPSEVVDPWLETVHSRRVAVPALVDLVGEEEPEARLMAPRQVREVLGEVVAGAPAVSDELTEEQLAGVELEHPEPGLQRR